MIPVPSAGSHQRSTDLFLRNAERCIDAGLAYGASQQRVDPVPQELWHRVQGEYLPVLHPYSIALEHPAICFVSGADIHTVMGL